MGGGGGGMGAAGMADDGANALRMQMGLSDTTPPDIAQRIGAFRSAEQRGLGGGMNSGAAQFHMKKEMLAQQLSGGDPQIMQIIRQARDEMDLEAIVGRLQGQASPSQGAGAGLDPRIAQMGLSETTPPDLVSRIERSRRTAPYGSY